MTTEDSAAGTLIVGANQAGVQLAVALREAGDAAPITLIGAEPHHPYQRPPLSKAFLQGKLGLDALAFRPPAFFTDNDITIVCAERVESIGLDDDGHAGSGTATTESGRVVSFDRLALTVGARTRRLTLPGADLDRVTYMRTADDAHRVREHLSGSESVVVIGGGFIGLEAAAVARAHGKAVTVVEAADRLIARSVSPLVSEFYRAAHIRRGVDIRLGAGVAALHGTEGRVRAVELTDGTRIPADLVVVGVGIAPRTELAEQLGLDCEGGIVVDHYARTSNPAIVAAGDCAVMPNPLTGQGRVRLESVQNAVSQAKVAAATLVGRLEPYTAVPWFWSDQYELKLQIAGLSAGYDHQVVRGDPTSEAFSVLYYRDDSLLAVDAVNAGADYMAVRKALTQGATIPAANAGNPAVALRNLITPNSVRS
ncbi:NAD(P)/FAD-dependent oxidoreductase [Rhodococcus sp. JVH1]|uniref:NAD(P)/FAD-dependent oxidoreductase n=1 Tax=Rhodococcus sp. JVH1 TaxID=745408 RepID=UPI0002721352|nr:FAD-dependent oxidoreductase [Rhodococcus sp. JVH1]EJI95752.1 ethA [Rhodococcus sp. JVH1]